MYVFCGAMPSMVNATAFLNAGATGHRDAGLTWRPHSSIGNARFSGIYERSSSRDIAMCCCQRVHSGNVGMLGQRLCRGLLHFAAYGHAFGVCDNVYVVDLLGNPRAMCSPMRRAVDLTTFILSPQMSSPALAMMHTRRCVLLGSCLLPATPYRGCIRLNALIVLVVDV